MVKDGIYYGFFTSAYLNIRGDHADPETGNPAVTSWEDIAYYKFYPIDGTDPFILFGGDNVSTQVGDWAQYTGPQIDVYEYQSDGTIALNYTTPGVDRNSGHQGPTAPGDGVFARIEVAQGAFKSICPDYPVQLAAFKPNSIAIYSPYGQGIIEIPYGEAAVGDIINGIWSSVTRDTALYVYDDTAWGNAPTEDVTNPDQYLDIVKNSELYRGRDILLTAWGLQGPSTMAEPGLGQTPLAQVPSGEFPFPALDAAQVSNGIYYYGYEGQLAFQAAAPKMPVLYTIGMGPLIRPLPAVRRKAPPLRQFPRSDRLAGGAPRARYGSSVSRQYSLRQGWANTHL